MTPLNQIQFGTGGPGVGTGTNGATDFMARVNAAQPNMNLTTAAFQNAIKAGDNASAYQMLMAGGGAFQDAARQAMGWDQNAFSNFVQQADQNKASYAGYDPSKWAQYGATTAAPGAMRNDAATTSQFNVGQGMGNYGALANGLPPPPPATIGGLAGAATGKPYEIPSGVTLPGGGQPATAPGGVLNGGPNVNPAGLNGGGGANSPTGVGSIDSGQPDYPLEVGKYLNPMMKYAMDQGISSINNSAAAAGNLNSGNTMKELYNFGMGMGAQNFNNAAQLASGQQAFKYGVDNNDRNFFYNAQNNDRNFDLNAYLGMGNLGLQGTAQQSANNRLLATLISQNMGAIGQAQSTGTIGAGNAITQAIQQWLASVMSGR